MPFRITPSSAPLGAIVTGLDVDAVSAGEAADLYQAFLTYGVLAFRGSTLDQRQHVALSAIFGKNVVHPITITSYCPQSENKKYFDWIADSFDLRKNIVQP